MKKIYKIVQYDNQIKLGGPASFYCNLQQARRQHIGTSLLINRRPDVSPGIILDDYTNLNQEFDTEEEAIAAIAACNFTNRQLQFLEIVVQLRNDEQAPLASELEEIKSIIPEDAPEWAKRMIALLEKNNAKISI